MAVYFIRAGEDGPVKIGHAYSVPQRLAMLQTGNHEELTVIRTVRGGATEERTYHRRFEHLRIRGEWFEFDPAMLGFEAPPSETEPSLAEIVDEYRSALGMPRHAQMMPQDLGAA